jgi:predicted O-methyltransferase YrrM
MSVLSDPELEQMLGVLHARSDAQMVATTAYATQGATPDELKAFRSDKLVALDRDKAAFCYQLCRANNARRIVEIGTSHGVSTLYLAAAVRDNIRATGGNGMVTGTEYEPEKAAAARAHFAQAGLTHFIDLREGDLRETLKQIDGPVDFVLVDIWIAMARPALERVTPHLRPGAIVVCDNT